MAQLHEQRAGEQDEGVEHTDAEVQRGLSTNAAIARVMFWTMMVPTMPMNHSQ